ncbi:MAG: hypothetical protein WBV82_03465 [Myxococcaceae bacterium]
MLSRYQMARGVPASKLPRGVRQDTRKHTRHILRPPEGLVLDYLSAPSDAAWRALAREYRAELERRFHDDRTAFDALANLARREDVHLGCSCPTKRNPDVRHCHTWLALEFMHAHYPDLDVRMPPIPDTKR